MKAITKLKLEQGDGELFLRLYRIALERDPVGCKTIEGLMDEFTGALEGFADKAFQKGRKFEAKMNNDKGDL